MIAAIAAPEPSTSESINVLIIDDSPPDAQLCALALRRGGMTLVAVLAEDERGLRAALQGFVPDVVICDFTFPDFDGVTAQRIVHETYEDVPLIFVSGSISEERAAMALQSGAVDYVMKSSLVRLPSAVRRAVAASRDRASGIRRARFHAKRLEALLDIASDPDLRREALLGAMLDRAACDMCPTSAFQARLLRIDGGAAVVAGVSCQRRSPEQTASGIGPIETNPIVRGSGRSYAWDDIAVAIDVPAELADLGWRAVICTHFESAGVTYSLALGSPEPARTPFAAEDFSYLDVLSAALANQMQVSQLEESLRDEEERSRRHAERLEKSWRIVNDSRLNLADKWLAMLAQAAASIWPGQGYRGILWRIDGEQMTVEATAESAGHELPSAPLLVGSVYSTAPSRIGHIVASGGGTRSWDDTRSPGPSFQIARNQGSRSGVITTFAAGGTTWALAFISGTAPSKPLGPLEHSYVEALASFFSNHVQQRWQFERLQHSQSHDLLTGLLNRSQFRALVRAAARSSARYAILMMDINAFHEMNDSYGHTTGDAILVDVANALLAAALPGELVGRVGGDTFSICIASPESEEFVTGRVRDFARAFGRPSTGDGEGNVIARSACIGVALAQEDGIAVDTLLSHADAALAMAKLRGHASTVFYEPGMERGAQLRTTLRNELAAALVRNEFVLYYQPHVDLVTGMVTGCEALIRWHHPSRGLLSPGHFIPFAEQNDLIASIDDWVMREAFAVSAELSAGRPDFRLYFNLSGRQVGDSTLVRSFVNAARSGVSLRNIGIEITETDAMRDVQATHRVLRTLRRLDVRIAIDDFGTGYSSLSSLKQLSVDMIKIDRSFVDGVTKSSDDGAIADTIISIATHFGFESLGEGAETPGEVDWLRQHGCRYVQGYAICHPLPLADVIAWLAKHEADRSGPVAEHAA